MSDQTPEILPAKVRPPRRISPFWLLPLVAFLIGGLLFFQIWREQGEQITIRFQDGAGISAGKTVIRFQGLQIGSVKRVNFSNDMREVEVTAEISPEAKKVLRKDTKFWLVTPTASLAGVSGLDALVSGNYITLLPGESDESEDEFVAESEPPVVPVNDGDLLIKLVADDLGSISVGASVYFRKVPVGTISDYRFTDDEQKVEIDVLINKKYAHLVRKESHFWNVSGIKANLSLTNGLSLNMDSLLSILQGAVAFDSPINSEKATQASRYQLFSDLNAAQRGIEIAVELPSSLGLKANETGVFYQGMQIGTLNRLQSTLDIHSPTSGSLLIDPNYQDLLREHSALVIKQPSFNGNKQPLDKVSELLRGNYVELIAGQGEIQRHFRVQNYDEYLLSLPNTLSFSLTAPKSYGVDRGQGIYYNDVQIGEILKRELMVDQVKFSSIIFPEFRQLIGESSKFVAISHLDLSVSLDGVKLNASSPAQWLQGGVRLLNSQATGKPQAVYPLYPDIERAEAGLVETHKQPTLTLRANEVAGIDKGSVLLYRNFQVGEVLTVQPQKAHFDVTLFVEPQYRHLLSHQNRFWIEPAIQASFSAQGLNLQTTPLLRTLKGAISFDNQGSAQSRTLYANIEQARSSHTHITLIAKDASKLNQGMPLKYRGLTVGKVNDFKLENAKKQVKVTAVIEAQYFPLLAKNGSIFRAISPEISTAGVKNLEAAWQNYISVELGNGKPQTEFVLAETENLASEYHSGLPITLETSDADGITVDAPVLYRGVQVGIVQKIRLNELGDRVLIDVNIHPKHRHLVRKNSQFWAASGYSMDITLKGVSIHSGTMSQLLNGGVAFSTPEDKVVQPAAKAHQRFPLQRKMPSGAEEWNQALAK